MSKMVGGKEPPDCGRDGKDGKRYGKHEGGNSSPKDNIPGDDEYDEGRISP